MILQKSIRYLPGAHYPAVYLLREKCEHIGSTFDITEDCGKIIIKITGLNGDIPQSSFGEGTLMYIREFGDRLKKTVIMLHGGGLSWWNYKHLVPLVENDYHIVFPVLNGHAGSDRPFTSIEDNARELVEYIDEHYCGHVFLIGGLSLGGQVLLEMISMRQDICSFAIVESALVIPMGIPGPLIDAAVKMSYPLISRKWFAKMQFRSLGLPDELFEDYFRDTVRITRQDMTAFLKANAAYSVKDSLRYAKGEVLITAGGKETLAIKRSAKLLHEAIKGSRLNIIPGYVHGELSISHPDKYAGLMKELTG